MKTIEERAKKHAHFKTNRITAYASYIKGAKEQQEIDIQRAVVWLESRCKMDEELYSINLDEFERAMKGE